MKNCLNAPATLTCANFEATCAAMTPDNPAACAQTGAAINK
jgi:hypothetical protein